VIVSNRELRTTCVCEISQSKYFSYLWYAAALREFRVESLLSLSILYNFLLSESEI
jgi:hypothetical protein